ncbi:MAG TPA: hypothetical protein PK156_29150 [Polyangium sp.]|nr:hypothetical protein [Polyangium sp.]
MKGLLRKTIRLAIGLSITTLSMTALAEPMRARDTARVMPKSDYSVGLTSPSNVGLGHGLELTTMLLPWFLLSPNLSLRAKLLETKSGLTFTTEYGLGVPSGAMWILRGYLFPTYEARDISPPIILQQHAGMWLSGGTRGVWTAHADLTTGLGGNSNYPPLEAWAPLNLWFGPATTGTRWHVGASYDYALRERIRVRVGVHGYALGKTTTRDQSSLYFSADTALEFGLGKRFRIALGAQWYNYDQRKIEDQQNANGRWSKVHVRSNDFYPTLDMVFTSP